MRLWYYDKEMSKATGPEEMKWGSKVKTQAGLFVISYFVFGNFVSGFLNNLS